MRPIRMVYVSTNALTRSGIAHVMAQSNPPIEVTDIFQSFEAVHQYREDNPADVILIDESLPRHTNLLHEVNMARITVLSWYSCDPAYQRLEHGAIFFPHHGNEI